MQLQVRVEDCLAERGIKKKHLASLLGIYPSQLSKWLSYEFNLSDNQTKIVEEFLKENS